MSSKMDARKMAIDEDDNDAGTFQQQALEIRLPGKDFDPNAAPTSGEEYLTHMAYERKNTPAIVSRRPKIVVQQLEPPECSDIQQIYSASFQGNEMTAEQIREFAMNSLKMLPKTEWKEMQTDIFKTTRERINATRAIFQPNKDFKVPSYDDPSAWLEFWRQNQPILSIILNFGQRDLELLLEIICEWLHLGEKRSPLNNADISNDQQEMAEYDTSQLNLTTQWLGVWLYAIFACLHLPLEPEVHSTLREIARICVRQRGRLTMPDEVKDVMKYNIFIQIIAHTFGQLDFGEFI